MFLVLVIATVGGVLWPLLPTEQTVTFELSWQHVVGTSESARLIVAAAAVLFALVGFTLPRLTKERAVGTPVTFSPPHGLGPVQTVYCAWENIGQHAVPATLLHLSNLGLITIATVQRGTLIFTRTADADQWKQADRVSRYVAEQVGLTKAGSSMEPTLGRRAKDEYASVNSNILEAARTWSLQSDLSKLGIAQVISRTLWFLSLIIAAVLFTGIAGPTMYGLPFAAFALAGFSLTEVGYLHIRTANGRSMWAQAEGFSRFLATRSNESRIAYSVDRKMQPNFMAYALAFNVATRWQESYLAMSPILQTAIDLGRQVDAEISDAADSAST